MSLDFITIATIVVAVTTIISVLMLASWFENRTMTAWAWWGAGFLLASVGFALITMRAVFGPAISIVIGNAMVFAGYSMIWLGLRVFDGRRIHWAVIAVAPAIWIAACQVPSFANDVNPRIVLASLLIATLSALSAREAWRGRAVEPLWGRAPITIVLSVNIVLLAMRIVLTLLAPVPDAMPIAGSGWFMQSALGGLLCGVVLGFLLLILPRQRVELRYKTAALVDPLTGLPNRRAFLERAEQLVRTHAGAGRPVAVLLFDLDRFKEINDCHGHAAGDRALQIFASVIARHLRFDDVAGRLGGEEFVAMLSGTDLNEAVATGELIRECFAYEADEVDGQVLCATVSVGIACTEESAIAVSDLLARADVALYRAKRAGRDRVEVLASDFTRTGLDCLKAPPSLVPAMG